MTRQEAYELMTSWVDSPSLQRHMLNVETAMVGYGRLWGEDEALYAVTGLLHDLDYERHPEEHPSFGVNYLRAHSDLPESVLEAIMGHARYTHTPRNSCLAKTLFAVDELTGLIQAAVLVRPDRDIRALELPSLLKKYRSKNFAAGVNREEVEQGARELGIDLEIHIAKVLQFMQSAA
jgi:predicted hydrolase (HD superfamily)